MSFDPSESAPLSVVDAPQLAGTRAPIFRPGRTPSGRRAAYLGDIMAMGLPRGPSDPADLCSEALAGFLPDAWLVQPIDREEDAEERLCHLQTYPASPGGSGDRAVVQSVWKTGDDEEYPLEYNSLLSDDVISQELAFEEEEDAQSVTSQTYPQSDDYYYYPDSCQYNQQQPLYHPVPSPVMVGRDSLFVFPAPTLDQKNNSQICINSRDDLASSQAPPDKLFASPLMAHSQNPFLLEGAAQKTERRNTIPLKIEEGSLDHSSTGTSISTQGLTSDADLSRVKREDPPSAETNETPFPLSPDTVHIRILPRTGAECTEECLVQIERDQQPSPLPSFSTVCPEGSQGTYVSGRPSRRCKAAKGLGLSTRFLLTPRQKKGLSQAFAENIYLGRNRHNSIATLLQLDPKTVQDYFKYRRADLYKTMRQLGQDQYIYSVRRYWRNRLAQHRSPSIRSTKL